jgi:hypothetical protein
MQHHALKRHLRKLKGRDENTRDSKNQYKWETSPFQYSKGLVDQTWNNVYSYVQVTLGTSRFSFWLQGCSCWSRSSCRCTNCSPKSRWTAGVLLTPPKNWDCFVPVPSQVFLSLVLETPLMTWCLHLQWPFRLAPPHFRHQTVLSSGFAFAWQLCYYRFCKRKYALLQKE